jgi:hypothetical protein
MRVAGLWPARSKLLAVIVDERGRQPAPISAVRTTEAAAALIAWLDTTVDALVVSDRDRPLIELARAAAATLPLALAPHELLEAIRAAAGFTHRPQRHTAAFLARWYLSPALRRYLRQDVAPAVERDQLPLL